MSYIIPPLPTLFGVSCRDNFHMLTSKFASRHRGLHFFDISTSKSVLTRVFFPRRCVHTRGSYGSCEGQCLIRVLQLGHIFPVNVRIKWLLWNLQVHVYCSGSHKVRLRSGLTLGRSIYPENFHLKPLLWNVQMRLRKLAQSLRRVIFPVNFGIKWLLRSVEVYFDCAGSHKVWS